MRFYILKGLRECSNKHKFWILLLNEHLKHLNFGHYSFMFWWITLKFEDTSLKYSSGTVPKEPMVAWRTKNLLETYVWVFAGEYAAWWVMVNCGVFELSVKKRGSACIILSEIFISLFFKVKVLSLKEDHVLWAVKT